MTDIMPLSSGQHRTGHDKNCSSQWEKKSFKTKDPVAI